MNRNKRRPSEFQFSEDFNEAIKNRADLMSQAKEIEYFSKYNIIRMELYTLQAEYNYFQSEDLNERESVAEELINDALTFISDAHHEGMIPEEPNH